LAVNFFQLTIVPYRFPIFTHTAKRKFTLIDVCTRRGSSIEAL